MVTVTPPKQEDDEPEEQIPSKADSSNDIEMMEEDKKVTVENSKVETEEITNGSSFKV